MSTPSIQQSPTTTFGHTLTSPSSSQKSPPSRKRALFQGSPTNTQTSPLQTWEAPSPNSTPKKTHPAPRVLSFGTPSLAESARLAGNTSPFGNELLWDHTEFAPCAQDETSPSPINIHKRAKTDAKIETSFRKFLASFPAMTTTTATSTSSKLPPPLKNKDASLSVEERISKLARSTPAPEKLLFIRNAAAAATTLDPSLRKLGEGSFSNVYLVPSNGNAGETVKKIFKENTVADGNAKPLQGNLRLYSLAKASETQFQEIRNAYTNNQFPVDVLEITNLLTWHQDGYFTQPRVTNMFKPSWDAFVQKITRYGNGAQITDEEEALLSTIQSAFQKAIELKLCLDFKPDNLGYISDQGQQRVVLIDTFGLSGSDPDDINAMTRSNINEFANGNSAIKAFLSQVVDR